MWKHRDVGEKSRTVGMGGPASDVIELRRTRRFDADSLRCAEGKVSHCELSSHQSRQQEERERLRALPR